MDIWLMVAVVLAYGTCYFLIPIIIRLAHKNQWLDIPTGRKKHKTPIPALGGVGMFSGFWMGTLVYMLVVGISAPVLLLFILTLLLVVLGVKDDLYDLSPRVKFTVQFGVSILLFAFDICRIDSFHGLFGIQEIPLLFSFIISILALTLIINAYNLIDGINGLAGSLSLMSSLVFGVYFYTIGATIWALVAFNAAAAVLGFLRYNFGKATIFMGDNGSTFMGLIQGILFFQFLNFGGYNGQLLPLALSIIAIPIVDLIRVFALRISKGRSPFLGDRSHIHYIMIKRLILPERVCYLLITFNLLLIGTIWNLSSTIPVTWNVILICGSIWILTSITASMDRVEVGTFESKKSSLEVD